LRPIRTAVLRLACALAVAGFAALATAQDAQGEETTEATPTTTTGEEEIPPEYRGAGTVVGRVYERGTRDLLLDARIEFDGDVAFPDDQGTFELRLPAGPHELNVVLEGYETLVTTVEVEADRRLELEFRLDRDTGSRPYETVIHGRRDEDEVTRISISDEEIHNMPGSMGDPFRAIEALPGVTPVLTGLPYYFVRGAPPSGTGFYLDGIRVPQLFHLALGPAVVHPSLVDRIDFFPGGAPAELGRYVGGVVRAETRPLRTDHWRSEWDLRLTDVGAFVEVPITDELAVSASGRYSYSAWLIQLFEPDAYLQFWDYQGRVDWTPAPGHRLTLFGFGSFDEAGSINDDGSIDGPRLQFHRVDLRYRYRYGRELRVELGGWFGFDSSRMDVDAAVEMWAGGPRASLVWSPEEWLDLTFGTDFEARHFPAPGFSEGDDVTPLTRQRDAVLLGTWAKAEVRPTEDTDIELGMRMDVHRIDQVDDSSSDTETWFDGRLSVRQRLTDWLWLKGSAGTFHQPQSFVIDLPGLGSFITDAGPQWAYQLSQGVEIALPWSLGLDIQGYYSSFGNLSEPDIGAFSDEPPPDDPAPPRDRDATGLFRPLDGRAYGLELLLRRRLGEGLWGWIAYTVSRSERDYRAGTATADFDQTHVLNLVFSWEIGAGWRVGAKFHFRSGRPYTPYECDRTTDETGEHLANCEVGTDRNEERLPPFYRLDLRVDKKWTFETWWFALYFEFINVTFTPEPLAYSCDCPDDRCTCGVTEVPYIVIPTLGFRGVY
jgi:hypothetical protein